MLLSFGFVSVAKYSPVLTGRGRDVDGTWKPHSEGSGGRHHAHVHMICTDCTCTPCPLVVLLCSLFAVIRQLQQVLNQL